MWFLKSSLLGPILPLLITLIISKYISYKKARFFNSSKRVNTLLSLKLQIGVVTFWFLMAIKNDIPDRYLLLFESLLTISTGLILLEAKNFTLLLLLIVGNFVWSIGSIIQHSIRTENLNCHNIYTKCGPITFSSPLAKYVKASKYPSSFCYIEVKR